MKTSCIKLLAAVLLLPLCSCHTTQLSAQAHIDKVVAKLEKNDKIEKSVVNNRNPKNGDLQRRIESYSFKDAKLTAELIDAFEQDENKAVKSAISRNGKNISYAFVFNKKKITISYYLSSSNGYTNLSIIRKSDDYESGHSYSPSYDYYYNLGDFDAIDWESIALQNRSLTQKERDKQNKQIENARKELERLSKKYKYESRP